MPHVRSLPLTITTLPIDKHHSAAHCLQLTRSSTCSHCRHDLYIASANTTAPGFSHSQGAMYLSTGWHGPARGMDLQTRAAKLGEIWRQLNWLEAEVTKLSSGGPHLLGEQLTLADLTWFPTCVFMEFILPRFFGWPHLFDPDTTQPAPTPFPRLAAWYTAVQCTPAFASVRSDILGYWEQMEAAGQFDSILDEVAPCTITDHHHHLPPRHRHHHATTTSHHHATTMPRPCHEHATTPPPPPCHQHCHHLNVIP